MTVAVTELESGHLLTVEDVSRSFGNVHALRAVTVGIRGHEVVGLVGENGAGKSTLLNILCGVDRPDEGRMVVRGQDVRFRSYHDATAAGVFRVFQELALVPNVAVYENLFLSHESHFARLGVVNRAKMKRRAADVLDRFGHGWIDPGAVVSRFDFSARQVIEIIKAFALAELLGIDSPILLLDEPTAGLSREEVDFFVELINDVRQHAGIIFVSHRLTELLQLSDRIYVLKDGAVVAEPDPKTCTEAELHYLMVGREREVAFYKEAMQQGPEDEVALTVHSLHHKGAFADVGFDLHRGEILGLAGVVGSGKSEVARAVFGDIKSEGEIHVAGIKIDRPSVASMIHAGVGYVSPDRATDGIVSTAPVSWNMSLTWVAARESRVVIDLKEEKRRARELVSQLGIRTESVQTPIGRLSGGNQQKAILARWLSTDVSVLLLDNPTKGIDAGAKSDVYEILRGFVAKGGSILLVSDELVELIGLSNRILAMKDGRVVAEIWTNVSSKPHEADVLRHMV